MLDKQVFTEIDQILRKHKYPPGQLIKAKEGCEYSLFIGLVGELKVTVSQVDGYIVPRTALLNKSPLPPQIQTPVKWNDEREMYIWMTRVRAWFMVRFA